MNWFCTDNQFSYSLLINETKAVKTKKTDRQRKIFKCWIYLSDNSMFSKKQGSQIGSPLLRHGEGPSLFSSSLKSKYMSPVKIANVPQKETSKEKGKFSGLALAENFF